MQSSVDPCEMTRKTWADVFEESEDQLQLARHPLDQEDFGSLLL